MTPESLRHQASAIRRLAVAKLDFVKNPNAIKRYAHAPQLLEGMADSANEAMEGAANLDRWAASIERERSRPA